MTSFPHRRLLTGGLSILSAASLVAAIAFFLAPRDEGVPVLVLAQSIGTGDPLDASSTRVVTVPSEARPTDALDTDDPLPTRWPGGPTAPGTILSESVVSGSALGRFLSENQAVATIGLDASQVPDLEVGDIVELWGFPENCDGSGCPSALLADRARIFSLTAKEPQEWAASPTVRIDVVIDRSAVQNVLGHAGNRTLSLALRASHHAVRGD